MLLININLIKKSLIVLFSIVWIVVVAEVFLMVFSPKPMLPRYIMGTDYGIRGNMPNQEYTHKTPDYTVGIKTNSHGIRANQEIDYAKSATTKRVVVLGDSFGMGYGVNIEDTFLTVLENSLESKGIDVEIVNLSVSGHGNAEELIKLQNEGLKYSPDLVLLSWHKTDIDDNVRSQLFKFDEISGQLVRKNDQYLPGVKLREYLFSFTIYRWMAGNSHFYNWIREFISYNTRNILAYFRTEKINSNKTSDSGHENNKKLTVSILSKMQDLARANNSEFLILDVPERLSRDSFISRFPRNNLGKAYSFNVVSPIDEFYKHKGELLYWEQSHGHFTPLGCQLVGDLLASRIIELGIFKNN
ncbi:MAG: hypothetical protein OEY89_02015 [Gammaproteobacteria bacterium]|nr:hypothetical protein [Gammaproteobacteria bacterium]